MIKKVLRDVASRRSIAIPFDDKVGSTTRDHLGVLPGDDCPIAGCGERHSGMWMHLAGPNGLLQLFVGRFGDRVLFAGCGGAVGCPFVQRLF